LIRLKLGDRTLDFDEKRALSAGDLVAIREMGVDPDRWETLITRVGGTATERLRTGQYAELAEALIQIGYLASVRDDHDLRWREFIWSLPLADVQEWNVEVVTDEPTPAVGKGRSKRTRKAASAPAL
jgi:hypothetical protein